VRKTSTKIEPPAKDRATARCWSAGWRQASQTFLLLFSLCRFASCALTNAEGELSGKIEGTVFVMEQGHQIYTSGAKVLASGPVNSEIVTNADGRFVFAALPPGDYTVEATSSGLEAIQTIAVHGNQVVQIPLQLRPPQVNTSVTVTANETEPKTPAQTETINEKEIRDLY
jgi:Carboxypeptidase regulatory-like domain